MKKISFALLALAIAVTVILGCASQKSNSTSMNSTSKGNLTGTWVVSDVKTEGFPNDYQIKNAFNMAPYESFVGSIWRLYSSYKGQISLTNGHTKNIYWDLLNGNTAPVFQFKVVPEGMKARDVREGYQLDINWMDSNHLNLRSPFSIENGTTAYIVYYLERQK